MEHSHEPSAVFGLELTDGSILAILNPATHDNLWKVIWRDDAAARRWFGGDPAGEHWFQAPSEAPMKLDRYLKGADAVYKLGTELVRLVDMATTDTPPTWTYTHPTLRKPPTIHVGPSFKDELGRVFIGVGDWDPNLGTWASAKDGGVYRAIWLDKDSLDALRRALDAAEAWAVTHED